MVHCITKEENISRYNKNPCAAPSSVKEGNLIEDCQYVLHCYSFSIFDYMHLREVFHWLTVVSFVVTSCLLSQCVGSMLNWRICEENTVE